MTVTIEDQPKPKLRVQWPKLIGGSSLTVLAIWCGGMDLLNNATFGMQKSLTIAGIFIAAAVGLMLLPVMANGWKDVHAWFMVVVCGIISMFAGFQNHMASQRNHDLEQAAITTRYNQAQAAIVSAEEDARQAKADIAGNGEMMGSEELSRIYAEAKGRRDVEMSADRGAKCGRNCRAAEKLMDETLPRIAAAKAKEDAQGRLDAALTRMTAEKSSAPAAPKQAGATAAEETVMAVILLLASIVGATFFERGVREIGGAVSWEAPGKKRAAPVERKLSVVAEAPAPGKKKSDMDGFLDSWTEASEGPPLQAGEFFKCLVAHWAQHHPGKNVPTTTALGRALGERYAKVKTGGKQCYMAKLRRLGAVRVGLEPASAGE